MQDQGPGSCLSRLHSLSAGLWPCQGRAPNTVMYQVSWCLKYIHNFP